MTRRLLPAFLLLALLAAGGWARFSWLGRWPVASDEFYSSQAARFWLERGSPSFPQGGLYLRGFLPHLVTAGSIAAFGDHEFAYRLPAALFGLLAAIPMWLLAARRAGVFGGFAAVAVLLLSSWHVEFARFARMYAPLLLVSLWFFHALVRGWGDGSRRWRVGAFVLACLAIFVHESAVILAGLLLVVALSPSGRRAQAAAALAVVAAAAAWLALDAPSAAAVPRAGPARPPVVLPDFTALAAASRVLHGVLSVAAFLWALRARTPLCGLVVVALFLALQPGAAAWALFLFCALGWLPRGLSDRRLAVGVLPAAVVSAGLVLLGGRGGLAGAVDYPPVLRLVVRPFVEVHPMWGFVLFAAAALAGARVVLFGTEARRDLVAVVLLSGLAAVALAPAPMVSTRYAYFLYPLLVVVLLEEAARVAPRPRWAFAAAGLALFVAGRDFSPAHLAGPAAPDANFRTGRFAAYADHWYRRWDFRALAREAEARGGPVILTHRTLPVARYLREPPLVYLPPGHRLAREPAPGDYREAWTDAPVLYGADALRRTLATADPRTVFISHPDDYEELGLALTPLTSGTIRMYSVPR